MGISASMNAGTIVKKSETGLGVFTTKVIEPGTKLLQFTGPVSALAAVTNDQLNYILRVSESLYLAPSSDARYVNHSCEPNCYIDDDFNIVARHTINDGAELTISYNRISQAEADAWGDFWHEAWSFNCACKTARCTGRVSKYLIDEVKPNAH